jgi:hypothetical protein
MNFPWLFVVWVWLILGLGLRLSLVADMGRGSSGSWGGVQGGIRGRGGFFFPNSTLSDHSREKCMGSNTPTYEELFQGCKIGSGGGS